MSDFIKAEQIMQIYAQAKRQGTIMTIEELAPRNTCECCGLPVAIGEKCQNGCTTRDKR